MANKLIEMAVETSDFGQELIQMEDAASARALLEVGGGGGINVLSVNGQVGAVELDYADVGAASAAQGVLAETALQPGDAVGAISSVNGQTGVVVLDYFDVGAASEEQGSLAETALQPGEAATLAQGAKADTAVQPGMLAAVATSGSYTDLSNRPTLGTASAQPVSAFASAAQGVKADSAVQPADLGSAAFEPAQSFATAAQGLLADAALARTLMAGYITGLTLEYMSPTSIRVTTGAAYIPAAGTVVSVASAITKTGLSTAATTWYHVYLFLSSGTPDIEIVTTAPSNYSGTASTKSGDTSRRYLGSIRAQTSNAIVPFYQVYTRVYWREAQGGTYNRVLSNGTATAYTTVSASAAAPITARDLGIFAQNNAGGNQFIRFKGVSDSLVNFYLPPKTAGVNQSFIEIPVNASQQFQYSYDAAPVTDGAYIDVIHYTFER